MKGKTLITTLFIAIFGALIGLFVYTRFLDKDRLVTGEDKDKKIDGGECQVYFTGSTAGSD